jgi:hypothetical protein
MWFFRYELYIRCRQAKGLLQVERGAQMAPLLISVNPKSSSY